MFNDSLGSRFFITVGVLLGGFVLLRGVSHGELTPLRTPLQQLPAALANWQGQDQPLEPRIVEALGVNDYLNRIYTDRSGHSVGLYVGYYQSQRTGQTIHSPKNCLPGAGWEPVRSGRLSIPMATTPPIEVNEYLVEKDADRYLVLYWYQAHGRVVASEYSGKVWLVLDAIARNRTDGALIRLFTPTRGGEDRARARAVQFVQALYPQLSKFIPD